MTDPTAPSPAPSASSPQPPVRPRKGLLRSYAFTLILLGSICVGCLVGWVSWDGLPFGWLKDSIPHGFARTLKPFGTVLLNALYVTVVPLIFFSIASAVASMASTGRLLKILGCMLAVFVVTGVVSSSIMVAGVKAYPPAKDAHLTLEKKEVAKPPSTADQIVGAITAPEFSELLQKKNILALVLFAMLVGLAASGVGEKGRPFAAFLLSANEVFAKVVSYVMYYAPVGLAAYFAFLVDDLGPEFLGSYARVVKLYYPVCIAYFFVAFTFYAFLAGGGRGVASFWKNIIPPALTAAGTGSSYATIPTNLLAADRIGVPREVSELVIPIGATIHMDGSCLSAIVKIAFLFGVFGRDFAGADTIAIAIGIAILSGTVMSGIPGGGLTGEILIVSLYGFPPEAFPLIATIGWIVDPPATMVNAVGDNVAGMIVARLTRGRQWMTTATAGER